MEIIKRGRLQVSDTFPSMTAKHFKESFHALIFRLAISVFFIIIIIFLLLIGKHAITNSLRISSQKQRLSISNATLFIFLPPNLLRNALIFNDFTDAQNLLRDRWMFQKYPESHQYFIFLGHYTQQFPVLSHELKGKANDFVLPSSVRIILDYTTKSSIFASLG